MAPQSCGATRNGPHLPMWLRGSPPGPSAGVAQAENDHRPHPQPVLSQVCTEIRGQPSGSRFTRAPRACRAWTPGPTTRSRWGPGTCLGDPGAGWCPAGIRVNKEPCRPPDTPTIAVRAQESSVNFRPAPSLCELTPHALWALGRPAQPASGETEPGDKTRRLSNSWLPL